MGFCAESLCRPDAPHWAPMSTDADPPRRVPRDALLDLACAPGHLLRRAQRAHGVLWSEEFGTELTGPQFAVLSSVARHDGIDQVTVGHEASLDKSTAVGIVRRLVRDGWVAAASDPHDGRRKVLHLTDAAGEALAPLTLRVRGVQERLLAPLDPATRGRLIDDLATLAYEGAPPAPEAPAALGLPSERTVGHLVRRAQAVHNARWAEAFDGALTGPQYAVLVALALAEPADQTALAPVAALDKSSLSEVVERLVARDLVDAAPHDADRRRKTLRLTGAARRVLPGFTVTAASVQDRLLVHLPRRRRPAFVRTLAALVGAHALHE